MAGPVARPDHPRGLAAASEEGEGIGHRIGAVRFIRPRAYDRFGVNSKPAGEPGGVEVPAGFRSRAHLA